MGKGATTQLLHETRRPIGGRFSCCGKHCFVAAATGVCLAACLTLSGCASIPDNPFEWVVTSVKNFIFGEDEQDLYVTGESADVEGGYVEEYVVAEDILVQTYADVRTGWYFEQLPGNLQGAYRAIAATLEAGQELVDINCALTNEDLTVILAAIQNDRPDLFWFTGSASGMSRSDSTSLRLGVSATGDELAMQRATFNARVDELLAPLWGLPAVDQEKYIHDALISQTTYIQDSQQRQGQTAYTALVERQSVCAGYARAFKFLLDQLGIPCVYVSGSALDSQNNVYQQENPQDSADNGEGAQDAIADDGVPLQSSPDGNEDAVAEFFDEPSEATEENGLSEITFSLEENASEQEEQTEEAYLDEYGNSEHDAEIDSEILTEEDAGWSSHAWCIVSLDGAWYNVDITWDDSSLLNQEAILYTHFNKSDEVFNETHRRGASSENLPACTTTFDFESTYGLSKAEADALSIGADVHASVSNVEQFQELMRIEALETQDYSLDFYCVVTDDTLVTVLQNYWQDPVRHIFEERGFTGTISFSSTAQHLETASSLVHIILTVS